MQFVDIDAIKGTVFGFLEGNLRAVLLLEGLEYLASICGSSEVIEMVRELGDRMQYEDDCLLISYDEKAWTRSEAAQLQRAAPYLQTEVIETWNSDPESLPACPSEETALNCSDISGLSGGSISPHETSPGATGTNTIGKCSSSSQLPAVGQYDLGALKLSLLMGRLSDMITSTGS